VKVAAIDRTSVKLFERPDPNALSPPAPLARLRRLDGVALLTFLDVGKEFRCRRVNAPGR